jgi:hypothetical protein
MSFSALVVLVLLSADVAQARGKLGSHSRTKSKSKAIIEENDFVHRLRACNAYTTSTPVEIVHHRMGKDKSADEKLTKAGVLAYKSCRDFAIHLRRGDSLEFVQNGSHVGSFAVASLPQRDALFLLVLHRRSPESQRPAFSSHIFSDNPKNTQLAVLDVYNGPESHSIQIRDSEKKGGPSKTARTEDLNYDTVVSITPGKYECGLKGAAKTIASIQAMQGESYIAMRVGLKNGGDFPEEVVVFPSPSGAARMCQGIVVSLMLLFLWQ